MEEDKESQLNTLDGTSIYFTDIVASSARKRKPTARYLEEDSDLNILHLICGASEKKDRKKKSFLKNESKNRTKWTIYRDKISSLARSVARDQHTIDTYDVTNGDFISKHVIVPKDEIKLAHERIYKGKQCIYDQFQELASENAEHTKWLKLKKGYDSDDYVDIEDIMCSVCGLPDEEDNDILFCDRADCLRAYHMRCLDPPITSLDTLDQDDDWFCHQCACIDDCLDLVGEVLGEDYNDHRELFPELRVASFTEEGGGNTTSATGQLEDSDSEDEDYNPNESNRNIRTISRSDDDVEVKSEKKSVLQAYKKAKYSSDRDSNSTACSSNSDTDTDNSSDSNTSDDDHSSTMDEGELEGLLMDAEVTREEVVESIHSRAQRPRRGQQTTGQAAQLVEGAADIGKDIAVVRRGILVLGTVVEFHSGVEVGGLEQTVETSNSSSSNAAAAVTQTEGGDDDHSLMCDPSELDVAVVGELLPSAAPIAATISPAATTTDNAIEHRSQEGLERSQWSLRLEDGHQLEVGISTLR